MKILIGTTNPGKIEGARLAFCNYFENFEIIGIKVDSNVSSQPINKEIYEGAVNRVNNLKKYAKENNISDVDFFVSCEAGLSDFIGKWYNLNLAYIENNIGLNSFGMSEAFPIPDKYVDRIKKDSLGKVFDEIFCDKELFKGKGGISFLTKNKKNRINLIEDAFIMALTKFINGDLWM